MFNPENQRRTTIIRGRNQAELDFFLPKYVEIISEICPMSESDFRKSFNTKLKDSIPISLNDKALSNHRTEIAGKLFGLWLKKDNDMIYLSAKGKRYIIDADNPAFFKDICYKFQFPNGMDTLGKIIDNHKDGIKIRQFSFILELLRLAEKNENFLTKKDIGYYVLNAKDVLQGKTEPQEVLNTVLSARRTDTIRALPSGSNTTQHINEQLNLLKFANLIKVYGSEIRLNKYEEKCINFIASKWSEPLLLDTYIYSLDNSKEIANFRSAWQSHYSSFDSGLYENFITSIHAITGESSITEHHPIPATGISTVELGTKGEDYVFDLEKNRVLNFDEGLAKRVINMSLIKGIGYDIQSINADGSEDSNNFIYIEVKSTKQVTDPSGDWSDNVNLTATEWVALEQHGTSYKIYRVYFTSTGPKLFVIDNPADKIKSNLINARFRQVQLNFKSDVLREY